VVSSVSGIARVLEALVGLGAPAPDRPGHVGPAPRRAVPQGVANATVWRR